MAVLVERLAEEAFVRLLLEQGLEREAFGGGRACRGLDVLREEVDGGILVLDVLGRSGAVLLVVHLAL